MNRRIPPARRLCATVLSALVVLCAAANPAQAGFMSASFSLTLEVPFNKPFAYTVSPGSQIGNGAERTIEEGNASASSVEGTSELLLPGLLGVPLQVTAGPISGIAFPGGVASAFSGIVSDSFEIQSLNPNADQTLTLSYSYSFSLEAQKFSSLAGESSNAEYNFHFTNYENGMDSQIFSNEVRLDPEDPAGTKRLFTIGGPIQGTYTVDLPANGSVDIGVVADVQGNAVWDTPEPCTASLAGAALLVTALAAGVKRLVRPCSRRHRRQLVVLLALVAMSSFPTWCRADPIEYDKAFVITDVQAKAEMFG